jgi:hypothetical protein
LVFRLRGASQGPTSVERPLRVSIETIVELLHSQLL